MSKAGRILHPAILVCVLAGAPYGVAGSQGFEPTSNHFLSGKSQLSYRTYGKGKPVILLAGGPGMESGYLVPVAQAIAEAEREAILLDLRGLGGSSGASRDELTVAGGVADIEALRHSLGADKVTLLGHSFGGALAQAYSAVHSEHVERLILLDSVGTDLAPARDTALATSWMKSLTGQERVDYAAAKANGNADRAIRIKFLGSMVNRGKGEAFVRSLPSPVTNAGVQARMSQDYKANYHVGYSPVGFPITIIYGDQDWIRAWQPELTQAYRAAHIILIPGSSHFPWIDNPSGTALAIKEALVQ